MDVKRIISELRSERQRIEMEILSMESSGWLEDRTVNSSFTGQCPLTQESEEKQEHVFCNLLTEFENAVRQHDQVMATYCAGELTRIFRERATTATRRLQSNAVAGHGN